MEISNEFRVQAKPEVVYATLLDFERVGPCIPGATVGPAGADGAHPAEIAVRLGPMKLTYKGTVRLDDRDDAARRATMVADVREVRGQGAARARMTMTVTAEGAASRVTSVTNVDLSGRAAQMGGGIVQDVAQRLVADMAANLERLLDTPVPDVSAAPDASTAPDASAVPDASTAPGASTAPAASTAPSSPRPAAPTPPSRPIGGFRLLLRALWHRLWGGRRRSASDPH